MQGGLVPTDPMSLAEIPGEEDYARNPTPAMLEICVPLFYRRGFSRSDSEFFTAAYAENAEKTGAPISSFEFG